MSKTLNTIAADTVVTYKDYTPIKKFFGIQINKVDLDNLKDALKTNLNRSDLSKYEDFLDNEDEIKKDLAKKSKEAEELIAKTIKESDETIAKKIAAFEQETKDATDKFNHELTVKTTTFEREQELKKLTMEHDERLFVSESKFTSEFIKTELEQAKKKHDADIATQTAKFEQELRTAEELARNEISHIKAITNAEISKAKEEAKISYTYDVNVLTQKVRTEVSDKYEELLTLAVKLDAAKELIMKLEEDKAYFQTFAEARIDRSEDVTDELIKKINSKDCAPVTVNVTDIKKGKKHD